VLVASVDVEWSKNYRITNGNRAFCYSIVRRCLPARVARPVRLTAGLPFQTTSVYLDNDDERTELVAMAAADIAAATETADLIAGHQLCSDLAVLSANAGPRHRPRSRRPGRRGTNAALTPTGGSSTPGLTPDICWPAPPGGWSTYAPNWTLT
jgi:hypothetical protein